MARAVHAEDRKTRRATRVREPEPAPGATVYRSDGAARGQGHASESHASWAAAMSVASADGLGTGAPHASSRGFLGDDLSNNIAEYTGLAQCLRRAVRIGDTVVVFQVDSLLVARQVSQNNYWACRSEDLLPLRDACRQLTRALSDARVSWSVQHIYREFNQVADSLANEAINDWILSHQTARWQRFKFRRLRNLSSAISLRPGAVCQTSRN